MKMYKVLIIDDEAPARIAISVFGHWADYHIETQENQRCCSFKKPCGK